MPAVFGKSSFELGWSSFQLGLRLHCAVCSLFISSSCGLLLAILGHSCMCLFVNYYSLLDNPGFFFLLAILLILFNWNTIKYNYWVTAVGVWVLDIADGLQLEHVKAWHNWHKITKSVITLPGFGIIFAELVA